MWTRSVTLLSTLWLVAMVRQVAMDTFTSYANLLKLYYMEEEALSNADVFLREEFFHHGDAVLADSAHNLSALRELVNETKQVHRAVGPKVEQYLSHPVNVFNLTKRLLQRWRVAIQTIRKSKPCREWQIPHLLQRLANIEDNLPSEQDLQSVAYSLLTIQHTQRLRTADLLGGRIGRHAALGPIEVRDQFQVAQTAVDHDDYYYAAQWLKHLQASGRLPQLRKEEHGFNATNVLGMLASAYFRIGMLPEALQATDDLLKSDPDNMVARSNKAYFEERLSRQGITEGTATTRPVRHGSEDTYRRNFEALCRGQHPRKNRNTCRLVRSDAVLWFHKLEVLRRKPPILVFHDVFSAKLMRGFVFLAKREYEKQSLDREFRTPEFTLALSTLANTQQRLQLGQVRSTLVKLPFTVTYPFKAGESEARNFGLQGFYVKPSPGFRVQSLGGHTASFIIFLNDVEMGGDIVFPSANARIQPSVGTVLFYFPSYKKYHAVCPVAYGTEWLLFHSVFEKAAPRLCRVHEDPSWW